MCKEKNGDLFLITLLLFSIIPVLLFGIALGQHMVRKELIYKNIGRVDIHGDFKYNDP